MVNVFGDESADETKQRVFAVGTVIGSESQWEAAVASWREALAPFRAFHAAEWESEYAFHPERCRHQERQRIYKALVQVLVASGLRGYGLAMDLRGWREVWASADDKLLPDVEYYKCFTDSVYHTLQRAHSDGIRDQIQFTFDRRQSGEYNAGRIYDTFVNRPEWQRRNVFLNTKISFDTRWNPRIQMADLVARESMKGLDNEIGPKKRSRRQSLLALASADRRFEFEFYTREYFQSWHDQFHEAEKSSGLYGKKMLDWLEEQKLPDTISNRLTYLIWLETHEELG